MFALPISICLFIRHQILVASIPASIWIPVSPAACPIIREHGKAPLTGQTRAHLGRPSPALQGADSLPKQHKGAPGGMREREKKSGGKFGTVGFRAELSQPWPPRGCSMRGAGTGAAPALLCGVSLFRFPPSLPACPPAPRSKSAAFAYSEQVGAHMPEMHQTKLATIIIIKCAEVLGAGRAWQTRLIIMELSMCAALFPTIMPSSASWR